MILYTAGYEGRSLPQFLAQLRAQGVGLVADVREAPVSRKPGFSKSALERALADAGLGYRHLRALGCPKPIRDGYRRDHDWNQYTVQFLEHLRRQESSIEELLTLSQTQPTVLLCYEADFNRCHRTYVACAVASRARIPIRHITAEAQVEDPP